MKPIPYKTKQFAIPNFLTEKKLCFFSGTRESYVSQSALETLDGVPNYLNTAMLTTSFKIQGHNVSAIDFIVRNTMDPSYDANKPTTTLNFSGKSITYTKLQTAFNKKFSAQLNGQTLPSLTELIKKWKDVYNDPEQRKTIEMDFMQPTNIDVVAYKFKEVFAYGNATLWSYIENSSKEVRSQSFFDDPALAEYMLESLFQCQPDSLLLSILISIKDEIKPKTGTAKTTETEAKRKEACNTLSQACQILANYYSDSQAVVSVSASASDVVDQESALNKWTGMHDMGGNLMEKFGNLSGGEKAITLIGALVFGRAIGHNFPKVNATVKAMILGTLGAPMAMHLGTKLTTGRSYLEMRKIKALLGGRQSNAPEELIAKICGFTPKQAASKQVQTSVGGFIDSVVKIETFASLPFRDVINTFSGKSATSSKEPISFGVLGTLNAHPKVSNSLQTIIPRLVAKFESKDTDPYSRIRYHQAMSSNRTWAEGMFFLMRNSAELQNLLDKDPLESKVMQQSEIKHLSTRKVPTENTKDFIDPVIKGAGLDENGEPQVKNHVSHQISSTISQYVEGHYYAPFLQSVNKITHNPSAATTTPTIKAIKHTRDRYNYYASFTINGATHKNLESYLTAIKTKLTAPGGSLPQGYPETLKLIFSGSPEDGKPLHFAVTWSAVSPDDIEESEDFEKVAYSQLVSLDTKTFGTPTLNLYTEFFRSHEIKDASILDAINDPSKLTLETINSWLPEGNKLPSTFNITPIQQALGMIQASFPKSMQFISFLLSKKPADAIRILASNDTAFTKISQLLVLLRTPVKGDESIQIEHERRVKILDYYLKIFNHHISNLNLNGLALQRAKVWAEHEALTCAVFELNGYDREAESDLKQRFSDEGNDADYFKVKDDIEFRNAS